MTRRNDWSDPDMPAYGEQWDMEPPQPDPTDIGCATAVIIGFSIFMVVAVFSYILSSGE